MLQPDQESWKGAWRSLGVTKPDEALFASLLERYAEPHRAYHTLDHIYSCLEHLNNVRELSEHPVQLTLAIWFHDAVYDIGRST